MMIDICLLRFCVHSQIAFVRHPLTVVMKGMKIHQVSMHVVAVNVFANALWVSFCLNFQAQSLAFYMERSKLNPNPSSSILISVYCIIIGDVNILGDCRYRDGLLLKLINKTLSNWRIKHEMCTNWCPSSVHILRVWYETRNDTSCIGWRPPTDQTIVFYFSYCMTCTYIYLSSLIKMHLIYLLHCRDHNSRCCCWVSLPISALQCGHWCPHLPLHQEEIQEQQSSIS